MREAQSDWIDLTVIGSDYDEQISAYGQKQRHRRRRSDGDGFVHDDWQDGPAPHRNSASADSPTRP